MKHRRLPRAIAATVVLALALAFVLTSCPSNRDGVSGQLLTAQQEAQSAARSAVLSLQQWAGHRSTQNLTAVQLGDARDHTVQAQQGIATLTAENPVDLRHQAALIHTMTDLVATLNEATAAVHAVTTDPDVSALTRRLTDAVDALTRDADR